MLVRTGMWGPDPVRTTLKLLQDMRHLSLPMETRDYNNLLSSYLALEEAEAVRLLLQEMGESGRPPNVITYNLLIADFARKGNISAVRKGLERMVSLDVKPDCVTYNTVLHALSQQVEQFSTAELTSVLQRMEADKIAPDSVTFNTLIKAYIRAGEMELGMAALSTMVESGFAADAMTYRTIICALLRVHDTVRAETHYHAMIRSGYRPPAWLIDRFITENVRLGARVEAERWFEELIERDYKPSHVALLAMVRLASGECNIARLQHWLGMKITHEADDSEDPGSFYRVAVQELLRQHALNLIPEVHALFLKSGLVPDTRYEAAWRVMYSRRNIPPLTVDAGDSSFSSVRPDSAAPSNDSPQLIPIRSNEGISFSNIISANRHIAALAKIPETLPDAITLLESLPRLGLAPTAGSYSPILGALGREPDVPKLWAVWEDMLNMGIRPDVACYNSKIAAYLRAGKLRDASDVLASLQDTRLPLNAYTTRLMVDIALRNKNYESAACLVEKICEERLHGAYKAIDMAITALCEAGAVAFADRCWLASRSIDDLEMSAPNLRRLVWFPSMAALLSGHIAAGDPAKALQVYDAGVASGMNFNEATVYALSGLLRDRGQSEDLRRVLSTAVKARLSVSRSSWTSIVTILRTVNGRLAASIIDEVIGIARTTISKKDAGFLLMPSFDRQNGEDVDALCRVFVAHGVDLDARVYTTLFASRKLHWSEGCLLLLTEHVIRRAKAQSRVVDEKTMAYALEALINCKHAKGVALAYQYMTSQAFHVHAAQRGRVVAVLCDGNCLEEAEEAVSHAAEKDRPGLLESLVRLYVRRNLVEKMEKGLLSIEAARGTHAFARACIVEAIKHHHLATGLHLLKTLQAQGVELREHEYVSLLAELAEQGRVDETLETICCIVMSGIRANTIVHNLLLKAYVRAGRVTEALGILRHPKNVSALELRPDAWGYNIVMHGLAKEGNQTGIQDLQKLMQRNGIPMDLSTYTALLAATNSLSDVRRIETIVKDQRLKPDDSWFRGLASAFARLKLPVLCEQINRRNGQMGNREWNSIVQGWKEADNYWKCVAVYDEMTRTSTRPDVVAFNTLIAAALTTKALVSPDEEVDRWMVELSRRRIPPDQHTHHLLLRQAAEKKDSSAAEEHFNVMLKKGWLPDEKILATLLSAYDGVSQLAKTVEIADEVAPKYNVVLTKILHHAILTVFRSAGKPEAARDWIKRMHKSGVVPDKVSWRHLLGAYVSAGDLRGAQRVVAERTRLMQMERRAHESHLKKQPSLYYPKIPDFVDNQLVHMIADAHCESGSYVSAVAALKQLDVANVDAVTMSIAMNCCLRAGWYDEADNLWRWVTRGERSEPHAKLAFLTRRMSPQAVSFMVNEAFIASYLDVLGFRLQKGNVEPGDNITAPLYQAWDEVLHLKSRLCGQARSDEAKDGQNWVTYPSENMCNSFIEALLRGKDAAGAVKVLSLMDSTRYPARPTPKTVRTVARPLAAAGDRSKLDKVRQVLLTNWKDLAPVLHDVIQETQQTRFDKSPLRS
ncbi:hypothetical protein HKX48_002821 [Thoreauomyces humboldtii]|nr:hypothetical protein HKX48_002821 [Thoreauomyces humboldtii]